VFGGLAAGYPMGYAVNDFYGNGGQQAVIVRLVGGVAAGSRDTAALAAGGLALAAGGLALVAASPGTWGNALRVRVTYADAATAGEVAVRLGVAAGDLFNLAVRDMGTGATETFLNLTVKPSAQQVDRVLASQSSLVRVDGALPAAIPPKSADVAAGDNPWDDAHSAKVTGTATEAASLTAANLIGDPLQKTGFHALDTVDLCKPPVHPSRPARGGHRRERLPAGDALLRRPARDAHRRRAAELEGRGSFRRSSESRDRPAGLSAAGSRAVRGRPAR
jgi:Bacteriophage tail sheath protein